MTATYLTDGQAVAAIARLSLARVLRGKALWFAIGLGLLPVLVAVASRAKSGDAAETWDGLIVTFTLAMGIIAAILVSSSLSDELDERTAAYLWSRAVPRWSIVAGKLVGLVPLVAGPVLLGLTVSWLALSGPSTVGTTPLLRALGAFAMGSVGAASVAALVATLAPRFGTPLAVGWLMLIDATFAGFDFSLKAVTVSYGTRALARGSTDWLAPVSLVAMTALCLWWALRRVERIE